MRRAIFVLWLVPLALAVIFWFRPPRGVDSYHHAINAVEQARAWSEGAVMPRYHRGWNGGTGTFMPTIYSPIPLTVQGGLALLVGDGQRAVGISLAIAFLVAAVSLVGWSREPIAVLVILAPYFMAASLSRSTTTEAWALAGAAIVLPLAMPSARLTRWRGLGLAVGVFLVAGCQVGMLLQLGLLLGAAWAASLLLSWKGTGKEPVEGVCGLAGASVWGLAGLFTGAILWIPAIVDAGHLAIAEVVSGPLDWRRNFLPTGSELGLLLTATAVSLVVIALMVIVRGEGTNRLLLAVTVVVGVVLSTPMSAPLWHLPKMENLQFPWRILGPTTLVAVMALSGLRGRWRTVGIGVLLLPLVLLPVRIGTSDDSVPTASTPEELALIAQHQWALEPNLPSERGFYAPEYHRRDSLDHLARQEAGLAVIERDVGGGTWLVTNDVPGRVLLPIQWWPEWRIEAAGRELAFTNRWGLVAIDVGAGTVEVHASLTVSRSRMVGALLSVAGLAALLILTIRWDHDRFQIQASRGVE
jgi:hypothetical protein